MDYIGRFEYQPITTDPVTPTTIPVTSTNSRKRLQASNLQSLTSSSKKSCIDTGSPPIVVGIGYNSGLKSYPLNTPKRKSFIRTISRCQNSAKSIARVALKDPDVMKYLAAGLGRQIKFEVKSLCSERVDSIQRSSDNDDIVNFPWATIIEEAKEHFPLLLKFISAATTTRNIRPNRSKFICVPFV
uniref:Uncharacterized protein n=1 Tax=Amphimedon queenslandica TaxID=400682 RepID=A0A1X7STZ8_AMPQE